MQRTWIALGALAGLTSVAMSALATHGLGGLNAEAASMVRSGTEIQAWHALALLACALWLPRGGRLVNWAGASFVLGIVLFCGALYLLGLAGMRPRTAPVGGASLLLGWLLLGLSGVVAPRQTARVLR